MDRLGGPSLTRPSGRRLGWCSANAPCPCPPSPPWSCSSRRPLVRPADVLGFSYGGLIAQRLALAAPRRIRRLVIASSSILPVPPGAFDGWPERTRRRAAAAAVWSDPAWSDPSRSGPELTRAAAVASAPADVWRPQARPGYLDRLAGVAELASSNRSTISARHGALKSSGMVQMYSDEDRTPRRSITRRPGTIRGLDA